MTYWDYKFLDWLFRRILDFPMPRKLNKKLIKVWCRLQSKKIYLWFNLYQTKKGFSEHLWQDGYRPRKLIPVKVTRNLKNLQ